MKSSRPRRKAIPLGVKLQAALHQLGFKTGERIEWHHNPPLVRRPVRPDGEDYIPAQLNPIFIVPLRRKEHDVQTHGPGGEKRITTRGSDMGELTHERHVTATEKAFRERLLRVKGETVAKGPRKPWPKRSFAQQFGLSSLDKPKRRK